MAASDRPLKVGVVGASIAHSVDQRENFAIRAHLPALLALGDLYEVAAVCTTRMESAQEAATRFGVANAFDSVESMLEKIPNLDVVCVSVRPAAHHGVVMAALKAGKHVYCEHPGGITSTQARDMWQVAQAGGLRSLTGHQEHFDPATLHMADLVARGYVGEPLAFSATHFGANYIAPRPTFHRWLFDVRAGGRPAYRSGHSLERILAVLGQDITAVCADFTIQVPERQALDQPDEVLRSDQVDNMNYLLRAGSTAVGTLQVSNTAWFGTGDHLAVYGTEGMLLLADQAAVRALGGPGDPGAGEFQLFGGQADVAQIVAERRPPEKLGAFQPIPVPPAAPGGPGHGSSARSVRPAWTELAAAIREQRECAPSLQTTYKIHRIWDAAEESVVGRRWVDVEYA